MFGISQSWSSRRRGVAIATSLVALLAAEVGGAAPGLIGLDDLAALRAAADAGRSPEQSDRERLLEDARAAWRWGSVSGEFVTSSTGDGKRCHPLSNPAAAPYLTEGAPDAYARALGAHLSGDEALAAAARARLLDLVDTHGFRGLDGPFGGGNQCILDLALSLPIWIETARLLEETSSWSPADGAAFRAWLSGEVYTRVAWASRERSNNWGVAGSLAAWSIATYVGDEVESLEEIEPVYRSDSPPDAAAAHAEVQLARLRGSLAGDARCESLGIQVHGGIPEELRRGVTGCEGTHLVEDDASLRYQALHVELLVLHAELMRRQADYSLYEAAVIPSVPAILQAILFVIDNPTPGGRSWPWPDSRAGTLTMAASYYAHPSLAAAADAADGFRGGRNLPYARITHGWREQGTGAPLLPEIGAPGRPTLATSH